MLEHVTTGWRVVCLVVAAVCFAAGSFWGVWYPAGNPAAAGYYWNNRLTNLGLFFLVLSAFV